uniref:Major facilitator superfamily (MFS) profile domain-containing protein n=1 Tax=Hirondellea gigas TaxID=1518452 RepID=A0A6A7FUX3_9CRUS
MTSPPPNENFATPLLGDHEPHETKPATPLPIFKMFILGVVQMTEAVMITQVLPYLPFMIEELLNISAVENPTSDGYDSRISIYTGLLAASFAFSQFLTCHLWGWISDRVGRRPVIIFGIVGNIVTIPLFGFSHSLFTAFLFRSLNGLINGNMGVCKTYLTEILDASNQAKGFAIVSFNFSVGLIIGPSIGGGLYGSVSTGLLGRYPWTLPCFVCASLSVVILIVAIWKLDETLNCELPTAKTTHQRGSPTLEDVLSEEQNEAINEMLTALADDGSNVVIITREHPTTNGIPTALTTEVAVASVNAPNGVIPYQISIEHEESDDSSSSDSDVSLHLPPLSSNRTFHKACAIYGFTALVYIIFETLYPIWVQVPEAQGGWGWNPSLTGTIQSVGAIGNVIMQIFVFHRISKHFGLLVIYRFFWIFPIAWFLVWPTFSLITNRLVQIIVMLALHSSFAVTAGVVFTVSFMLVSNSVHREVLGSANGIGQALASLVRGVGPSVTGLVFGWSLVYETNHSGWITDVPVLNRYLMFYLNALFAVLAVIFSLKIPKRFNQPRPPTFQSKD